MADVFPSLEIQRQPRVFVATIPGRWLLQRTTPSWRIKDPDEGFQRMVDERRARSIANAVLAQKRTFPNAVVLATDSSRLGWNSCELSIPRGVRFLVVDGQHRLYAQKFSDFEATYVCTIHVGLEEREMAQLFLEINDTQKRVPSSLRWDLVRLVKPEDNPAGLRATDLVYELYTEQDSPLFLRVDLTGESRDIALKQGSLAPEVKRLVGPKGPLRSASYDTQSRVLREFFWAVRERDVDGWESSSGPLYKARVIRSLMQLLPEVLRRVGKSLDQLKVGDMLRYFARLNLDTLSDERIRAKHGNAGIAAIKTTIRAQILK